MKKVFIENFIFIACVLFVFWCLGVYHVDAYNVEGIWVSQNRPAVGSWAFDGTNKYTWQEDSVEVVDIWGDVEYWYDFGTIEIEDPGYAYEDDDYIDEFGNIWYEE